MPKTRLLIFGGSGMLGRVFSLTQKEQFEITALARSEADITDFPSLLDHISLQNPDVILNFAAYTDVEWAEGEGMMESYTVNALWAQNVAKAAWAFGIPLIHISTDYVFDGAKSEPYLSTDTPHPINNYGMSKYLGEVLMRREYSETIIVRTSGLYGWPLFGSPGSNKNFINKLLEKNTGWPLRIISDQFTIPTSAIDLSNALWLLIENREQYEGEILHFVSENTSPNPVSWYDFALEIKKRIPTLWTIESLSSQEYGSAVKRPKLSVLNNTSNILLPDWKEALDNYLGTT